MLVVTELMRLVYLAKSILDDEKGNVENTVQRLLALTDPESHAREALRTAGPNASEVPNHPGLWSVVGGKTLNPAPLHRMKS